MYDVSIPMALVDYIPSVLAARMKKKGAVALFVLSFVCSMGMGYLSGRDGTSAAVNWAEQLVNCLGQGLLLAGVLCLHKAGSRDERSV